MAKKIKVLYPGERLFFLIGDRQVFVSESMPLKDAELIAKQYPGLYFEIIDEPKKKTVKAPQTKAPETIV